VSPRRRRAKGLRVIHRRDVTGVELVELRVLARHAGVDARTATRFVALGLLEPAGGTSARPLFDRDAAALLALAARLRHDLELNHAGAVLACELLARIEHLELRLESFAQPEDRGRGEG
jgi:chaperone modulatory protein CbpM